MKRLFYKGVSVLLLAIMLLSIPFASYAANTRASNYLSSYNAYTYSAGRGNIEVWFNVVGTGTMDELGTLTIILRESKDGITWKTVETFRYFDYTDMLSYNDAFHSSHVSYSGTAGRYYMASVTFWGGNKGAGESRVYQTASILAPK